MYIEVHNLAIFSFSVLGIRRTLSYTATGAANFP